MVKAVIFDCDGTLIDFSIDWVKLKSEVLQYLKTQGISSDLSPLSSEYNQIMLQLSKKLSAANFQLVQNRVWEIMSKVEFESESSMRLVDGATSILLSVTGKVKIGVLSTNSQALIKRGWQKFRLPKWNHLIAREDVTFIKPHPEGLITLINSWKLTTDDVIYLGDSNLDVMSANKVQIRSIYFNRDDQVLDIKPSFQVNSLSQAQNLVQKLINDEN